VKPQPSDGVIRWLAEADEDHVFISVISIAEIRRGLERMPQGQRRKKIANWLHEDLAVRFDGRILPLDAPVAHEWGVVAELARSIGLTIGIMDCFIAATARHLGLTLVTRNRKDFRGLGIELLDPWIE